LKDTTLDPYIEIANKLHEFMEAYKNMPMNDAQLEEQLKFLKILREGLETSLKQLANPSEGLP
jgi:hypothetical protein